MSADLTLDAKNAFALLGIEAAPMVEADALKQRYSALAGEHHPDRAAPEARAAAEASSQAINRAYQTLREPKARLAHLYELATGAPPPDIVKLAPGTMELFVEIGTGCREVDTFLAARAKMASAVEKAGLAVEEMQAQEKVQALQQKLGAWAENLEQELAALDADWRTGKKDLEKLEALYRRYSYLARWRQQLEERMLAFLS